jgi:hypothetical protein
MLSKFALFFHEDFSLPKKAACMPNPLCKYPRVVSHHVFVREVPTINIHNTNYIEFKLYL